MRKFYIDFETRSAVDIKKTGAHKYARHASTEIICISVAFAGEKPRVYTEDQIQAGVPELRQHATDPSITFCAHSAQFEYNIWEFLMRLCYDYPSLADPRRWDCTLSRAVMCGLPAALEKVALALDLPVKKDMAGRAALMKICKPVGWDALGDPIWNTDPELYALVYKYCGVDVETEMAADARLPEMSEQERQIWELDLTINCRGIQVDVPVAKAASALAASLTVELNNKLHVLTTGMVDSASRVAAIKRWLELQGVEGVTSLDKAAVNVLLADPDIPQRVKDVVGIRRQVGKSSTAKFTATINAADEADHRVRGALQYHAAATGRWGGRLIQPHNYPHGLGELDQERAIVAIMRDADGAPGLFSLMYGDEGMQTLSDVLRGTIVAAPGKILRVADFSSIEARTEFWEAGDVIALDKYRRGVNLYVDMARYVFGNQSIEKKTHPSEYDIGKRIILGCGYGMGWVKFKATCAAYGVDITDELAQRAVKAYREKYRSVVNLWYSTERAAISAIKSPGTAHQCAGGRVFWGMDPKREFLGCRLPSGRFLRYFHPVIKMVDGPMGVKEEIHYQAPDVSGALAEFKTYGGSLVENITQATARDLMAHAMLNCEGAGYPIVLTVHDEIVAETPAGQGNIEEFIQLMCSLPSWADGCPVTAEGWSGRRYRK